MAIFPNHPPIQFINPLHLLCNIALPFLPHFNPTSTPKPPVDRNENGLKGGVGFF